MTASNTMAAASAPSPPLPARRLAPGGTVLFSLDSMVKRRDGMRNSRRESVGENSSKAAASIRCAIYTRKSTDEGLAQEFNSLDAQRSSTGDCLRGLLAQEPSHRTTGGHCRHRQWEGPGHRSQAWSALFGGDRTGGHGRY